MSKPQGLSRDQQKLLDWMRATHTTVVHRHPGGYWYAGGTEMVRSTASSTGTAPVNWVGTTTIRAMEKRGWLRRAGAFPDEWRDSRVLVPEQLPPGTPHWNGTTFVDGTGS